MSNASFGAPRAEGQPFAPTMDYYIPQWEERTSYGMRRIDPYTKLFEDRIIFLGTPISDEIANAVMAQLLCLQQMDADRDIEIYINSPGGSFTALTAIYDTMRYIKPDVRTVCLGQAASDRKSTRLNSSHANISYAVFCLKKKKIFFSLF